MHKIFVHKFRDREIEMCSIDKTRRREQLRVESFSNKASGGETMAEAGCIMASALARDLLLLLLERCLFWQYIVIVYTTQKTSRVPPSCYHINPNF